MITQEEARKVVKDDATAASILFNATPDAVGETLRALTFPEHGGEGEDYQLGCYTTFEYREDAEPIEGQELVELCEIYYGGAPTEGDAEDDEDFEDEMNWTLNGCTAIRFVEGGAVIECFWFWDGDGTLIYRITSGGNVRVIANNDCKKSYRWVETERTILDASSDAEIELNGDAITVYRRMVAAAAGARAERDIMRSAIEKIAAGEDDPVAIAQGALDADRKRREDNLAALNSGSTV